MPPIFTPTLAPWYHIYDWRTFSLVLILGLIQGWAAFYSGHVAILTLNGDQKPKTHRFRFLLFSVGFFVITASIGYLNDRNQHEANLAVSKMNGTLREIYGETLALKSAYPLERTAFDLKIDALQSKIIGALTPTNRHGENIPIPSVKTEPLQVPAADLPSTIKELGKIAEQLEATVISGQIAQSDIFGRAFRSFGPELTRTPVLTPELAEVFERMDHTTTDAYKSELLPKIKVARADAHRFGHLTVREIRADDQLFAKISDPAQEYSPRILELPLTVSVQTKSIRLSLAT